MESAKRMFQTVDADDSGFIDPIEFQRFMRKLDATMSATDIKLALGYAPTNDPCLATLQLLRRLR
eukprot:COSAG04_NODE_274_length_18488_cov_35.031377_12_plen_65_part_00